MRTGNEPMQPPHSLPRHVLCRNGHGWTFDLELESGKMRQNFDKELILVSSQNEQFSYIWSFIIVSCASALAVT